MRICNEIQVNTRVEDCRYILSEIDIADILSRDVSFDKFNLLSTWFADPAFLVSNDQNHHFEGLRDKTVYDEVRIKTVEDHESNVTVSVSDIIKPKSISPPPIFWE